MTWQRSIPHRIPGVLVTMLLFAWTTTLAASEPSAWTSRTDDGVVLHGDDYHQENATATILLFHQGGSNARAEYAPIIPRLLQRGFRVLAIDQRMGGQMYGSYNRTVADFPSSRSYCDAQQDLATAVDRIRADRPGEPIILWGSSYSAALAVRVAAANPEQIAGVLAFSPASGGPMAECRADEKFAELQVPLLLLRPVSEVERPGVAEQLELAREHGHATYVADPGTHGSSLLLASRAGGDTQAHWDRIWAFLEDLQS